MALSKIPDLTHTYRGQEYTFVDQLEGYLKELECPICKSIVSEPLQTSCGHIFCTECHNKMKSYAKLQCPMCNQLYTATADNFNDRKVRNLKVKCTKHKQGCDWVGCLGDEKQHRMKQDGCQYEETPCSRRCGATIRRMDQLNHLKRCPNRPHKCEYCGAEGPYQHIVGDHRKTCCKYPVLCPNGCKEKITREKAERQTKPLKDEISRLKFDLQAEQQCVCKLQETNMAGKEQINALKGDIRAKKRHIAGLKQDVQAHAAYITQLEEVIQDKADHITQLEEEIIPQLEREVQAKAGYIGQLQRENQYMAQQMTQLERENQNKAQWITWASQMHRIIDEYKVIIIVSILVLLYLFYITFIWSFCK